jgi:hypothetical protein
MSLSFLSSTLKSQIQGVFDDVHVTLGKEITAYKDAERNVVALTPAYNHLYDVGGSLSKTTVSSTFTARIKYLKSSDKLLNDGSIRAQLKVPLPEGVVRVKVDPTGFAFLQDAKRIELDGTRYSILNDSFPKSIGPFDFRYYAFYLIPTDPDDQ